jgi:3-carboxymuconate cyclase
MKKTIYTGTYTGTGSEGIYRFNLKDGMLSEPELFCAVKNPKYISLKDGVLAACVDLANGAGAALIDKKGKILDTKAYETRTSCFIAQTEDRVYTANYHEGTFTALEKKDGKLKLIRTVSLMDGGGCHQVLLWNNLILVPTLFMDRVAIYDQDLNAIDSIRFHEGTGPRHGVFSPDGTYLYLVSELSNELFVIHCGDWKIEACISVLENEEKHVRGTAAIRINEAGDRLYVSTRGKDVLSVVELRDHIPTLLQVTSCGGRQPRDFVLADGYLVCANRYSHDVVSFQLKKDGTIGKQVSKIEIAEAVSLVVA